MRKKVLTVMVATMVLGSSLTAFAAPETMADGTVFDAEYYAQNNPDVVSVYGTDKEALLNHYITYGKAEGRLAVNPADQTIQQNPESNIVTQSKITPDGRVFTVSFTDDESFAIFKSVPPNNGEYYEIEEIMALNRNGQAMKFAGAFDTI